MEKVELLQELKDKINKYGNVNCVCIFNDEKIIEYENIKGENDLIELDDIEIIDDGVNCDTCQIYNYTKTKQKNIYGYIESIIVINKLNVNEYKIDRYLKLKDEDKNIEFENNKQYKIILIL